MLQNEEIRKKIPQTSETHEREMSGNKIPACFEAVVPFRVYRLESAKCEGGMASDQLDQ